MTFRRTLLAGAGLGALMLVATPGHAKPANRASASISTNAALLNEIKALRAQVDSLNSRLDAQESAQRENAAGITSAQAAAADAATQAAAAQSAAVQAQTAATTAVPTEVKSQLASFSKGKWWDSTTISGRMYFNFSNLDTKSNGVKAAGGGSLNGTGFNIKRFYLGVDHKFSPIFAANVTMDISNVVGQTSNNNFTATSSPAGSNLPGLVGKGFYVKKAYLQAKLDPALTIRLGAADMPWVPYAEGQYGYRHIENTLIDRTSYGTSADWGVHVMGDLAGGLLSYQVSMVNGAGYRNVKVSNSVDFEGRVSAQYKGIYAGVGGYTGKRGSNVQGTVTEHTANRFNAIAGYKNKLFGAGVEYFTAKNWNNVTTVATDKSDGWSAFGNVNFAQKWSAFGRYDRIKPTKTTNDNLKDEYYNIGIQWEPVKIVDLALVYKHEKVRNGTLGTTNGTIGGANPAGLLTGGRGTYNEIGLFGQLRF